MQVSYEGDKVLFDGVTIGHIIQTSQHTYQWQPAGLPEAMAIPATMAMELHHLKLHLEWLIGYQTAIHGSGLVDTDTLHPALRRYRMTIVGVGPMIKHPLLFWIGDDPLAHAQINGIFLHKQKLALDHFNRMRWNRYVFLHERAFRLRALQQVASTVTDRMFWRLLRKVWLDSENISENYDQWLNLWTCGRANRHLVMSPAERQHLAELPNQITIYRGVGDPAAIEGLSWTLSAEQANWFAKRYQTGGFCIGKATICRDDVFAYFSSRGEEEVVVDPEMYLISTVQKVS